MEEKKYIVEIIAGEEWWKIEIPFNDLSIARNTADSMMCALQESACKVWSVSVKHGFVEPEIKYVESSKISL